MAFLAPLAAGITGATGFSAGSLLSAGSSILGTISAIGQANYQSQVAKNNATIARDNAQKASDTAQQQQLQADQESAALVATQEATQAGSGLSVNGASQLRTRRTAMRLGRQDAMTIRTQGNSTITDYLQQAENYRAESANAKAQIPGILIGGAFDMGSSLIGGSTSVRNATRYSGTSTKKYAQRLQKSGRLS